MKQGGLLIKKGKKTKKEKKGGKQEGEGRGRRER